MADEAIPITEVRRVVIEFDIKVPYVPNLAPRAEPAQPVERTDEDITELADRVRREIIRTGIRNGTAGIP